jgi:hypothetical protein
VSGGDAIGPIDASVCMPAVHVSSMRLHACMRARGPAGPRALQQSGSLWARDALSLLRWDGFGRERPAGILWRHVRRGQRQPEAVPGTACSALIFTCVCVRERMYLRQRVLKIYFICIRTCMYVYAFMSVCRHVCMRVYAVSVHCGSVRRLETRWVQCPRELDAAPPRA